MNNLGINIKIINIKTKINNPSISISIIDADEKIDNINKNISIVNIDEKINNPYRSMGIAKANKRINYLDISSSKADKKANNFGTEIANINRADNLNTNLDKRLDK